MQSRPSSRGVQQRFTLNGDQFADLLQKVC